MQNLGCVWNRSRLGRYAAGALSPRTARSVEAHLGGCDNCRSRIEQDVRLHSLVHAAVPEPAEPDWTGFWPGIQARLARETPKPIREPWWLPFWKPFWGHPRLALSGAMAAVSALAVAFGPGSEQVPAAWASPVVVQDVTTSDPDRSVMVYSTPDNALTVIWLFSPEGSTEES